MVNVKNLFAPLGICQIVGLVLGILVLILGIVSRPYLNVREGRSGLFELKKDEDFHKYDFITAHDVFFIGIFLPLLLSILSIVLTILDSKEKIPGGAIHALIGLFCFVISIYLLYGITTIRSNHKSAECNETVLTPPHPKPKPNPSHPDLPERDYYGNTTSGKELKKLDENKQECGEKYLDKHGKDKKWEAKILEEYCDVCIVKPIWKFELCVAAGVFGFIYALVNIGSAVLAFLAKRD